jgi:N-acetylneuraminate synthase
LDLGCQIYKIASFELTFDDLLIEVASTGKPIILSTGMSEMSEVDHAVDLIRRSGNTELAVLHCCSAYPAPYDSINLNAMLTMQERFDLPVGFSDHTVDAVASLTAISMGACLIEKHFTNDPNRSGPDHRFSATPQILKEISHGLRIIDQLRGKHVKKSASEEAENKIRGRRSAFAVRNLCQGDIIQNDDFRFVRPGVGVPANQKHLLIGKVLLTEIPAGYPITLDDLGQ